MKELINRIKTIACRLESNASWDDMPFARKSIREWFKHELDSDDVKDLGLNDGSSDLDIEKAIIKEWNDWAEELRDQREWEIRYDLGLVDKES